jgi:hypothetical protein
VPLVSTRQRGDKKFATVRRAMSIAESLRSSQNPAHDASRIFPPPRMSDLWPVFSIKNRTFDIKLRCFLSIQSAMMPA